MKILSNKLGYWPKALAVPIIAAAASFTAGHASAQISAPYTVYSSNFNTDSDGTAYDNTLSLSGQGRWDTNDITQNSDYVGPVAGFSANASDYSGELGGQYLTYYGASNYNTSPTNLFTPFANGGPTAGVIAFNVDFEVTGSQLGTAENNFAWSFRNTLGNNVFAINFNMSTFNTTGPNAGQGIDSVKYTIGNLPTQNFASSPGSC